MASIQCYLKELDKQRDLLANILVTKGIDADESETYNSLVAKVAEIETGGGGEIYDLTSDSDYICDGDRIIYYVGESVRPRIPAKINGTWIRTIGATAFNMRPDVVAVKIPEGIEVIE